MRRGYAVGLVVLFACAVGGCIRFAGSQVTTGLADGEIRFESQSPAVSSHLNGLSVVADPSNSVGFYRSNDPFNLQATAYVDSGVTDPVASYAMTPVIDDTDVFLVEVTSIRFSGVGAYQAMYRFGSRFPGSPAAESCGPVTVAGITCDVGECAGLVRATVRLGGEAEALAALDPAFPILCGVGAAVNEGPGSPLISDQSGAGNVAFLPVLTSTGLDIPFLARALGAAQPLTIGASCFAQPVEGEERFPVDSDTGLTSFTIEIPLTTELACGAEADIDLEIPVVFNAGNVTGLFDISGETETATQVRYETMNMFSTSPPAVPADEVPTEPWELESVLVGEHSLFGQARVAGNRKMLRLPFTRGANGLVTIAEGETTDLGSRFVALPHRLSGEYQLYDPAGLTDLAHLQTEDFTNFDQKITSYQQAEGLEFQAIGGGDGVGGLSRTVFESDYDAGEGRYDLEYELLIAGLSPVGGAADGTSALMTPWRVNRSFFRFVSPDGNHQNVFVNPRDDLSYDAVPGGEDGIPAQQICFGQHNLTLRSDADQLLIYRPRSDLNSGGEVIGSADLPGAGYTFYDSDISGEPRDVDDRADEVTIRATLPEGLEYTFRPRVRLVPADGNETEATLEDFEIQTALGCGQVVGHCLEINDVEGSYSGLTIGVEPQLPYCNATGSLDFDIVVDSTGQDVNYLRTRVFSEETDVIVAEELHCTGCSPDPEYTFSTPALDSGNYRIEIDALTAGGTCEGGFLAPFTVPDEPLSLQCADDFEFTLPGGADSIHANDPAIADVLTASTSGGCGFDVEIADDRPAEFVAGDTTVTFAAAGLTCQTTVTVEAYEDVQIAFIEGDTLRVFGIWTGDLISNVSIDGLASTTSFSADGERIAMAPAGEGNSALLYDFGSGDLDSVAGERGVATSFSPVDSDHVAIVSWEGNDLTLSVHTPSGVFQDQFPAGPDSSTPAIAWNATGDRIGVMRTTAYTPPASSSIYRTVYREYVFDGGSLTIDPDQTFADQVVPPPGRHEPFELAFVSGGMPIYTSAAGLMRVLISAEKIEEVETGGSGLSGGAFDISNSGQGLAWAGDGKLFVLPNLASPDPAALIEGTTNQIEGKPELAVSNDLQFIALTKSDAVVIFRVDGFEVVRNIDASNPRGPQFRPRPAE